MQQDNVRLVVNADDFGLSQEINVGIVDAFRNGIVTSVSIVTNTPFFDDALGFALKESALSVGLHLNLTEGRPVTAPSSVPSLVNREGRFYSKCAFVCRALAGRADDDDLNTEISAQIEKILSNGGKIDHLDSHHHIHQLPKIAKIVGEMSRRYNIPHVRRISSPESSFKDVMAGIQQGVLYLLTLFTVPVPPGTRCRFWGFELMLAKNKKRTLSAVLNRLTSGRHELMCHPARLNTGRPELKSRFAELQALMDPTIRTIIESKKIILVSFKELNG